MQQEHKELLIYWGDEKSSIDVNSSLSEKKEICETISSAIWADDIVALKQTHSNSGFHVSNLEKDKKFFTTEGDFLITQESDLGIAVITADCVPLVLHNLENQAIAIVHVGWKGAVTGIVKAVCTDALFSKNMDLVQAFIGPSALDCCYEVQKDFLEHFDEEIKEKCFVVRDEKIYYNNTLFIRIKLKSLGIFDRNIYTDYNICTICSEEFCSYRRDGKMARRNVTVALLR